VTARASAPELRADPDQEAAALSSFAEQALALSEAGETVYLQSGVDGHLTGYSAEQQFDAAESGVAFGRYFKSTLDGGMNFVAMAENTPNGLNSGPKVGPIVFMEIMYNPNAANTGDEYIELKNITAAPMTLGPAVDETTNEMIQSGGGKAEVEKIVKARLKEVGLSAVQEKIRRFETDVVMRHNNVAQRD
jgi:hypothetical protein